MLQAYLKYRRKRVNAHGIHSPFVFEFYNEVIRKSRLAKNPQIEALRTSLLNRREMIAVEDFGAGSRKGNDAKRAIKEIAKNAAVNRKYGELMSRMIQYYQCENVLELGTSLGIGSAYLAQNAKKLVTIEGCPQTASEARKNFEEMGLANVKLLNEKFSDALASLDKKEEKYDLIYIDGNHQLKPTLEYFEFAANHADDHTFIILDDINWSAEMQEAWEKIKASSLVNVTMDLFQIGIACKRKGQRKEHFILKF